MPKSHRSADTEFFWNLAGPLLDQKNITEGTLMGFPCLRVGGDFFATCDHRSGDLILKLSRERVKQLIDAGIGLPFAPAGRVFKEWVRVEDRDQERWEALIHEAKTYVGSG